MARKIRKVAIANRGEVAVRIIRACHELGMSTVLLHSEVDVRTKAYRLADETFCIGAAPTSESYLNIQNNIDGARAAGADAIHPGFGFLSENADFASAVEKAGMIFVGPKPETIRLLGDKISAKNLIQKAKVPTVPGYMGSKQDIATLLVECDRIGYPVIVKAAAGGGGRGMKVLRSQRDAAELIASAQRESQSAFGSSIVFLEKYLDHAKHIEFQIFGDAMGRCVHLFDRECTVQRRHQKIIEESISPSLSPSLRSEMAKAAVNLAQASGYKGAGTVEFLVQDGKFYFLEMNTRLQVEHPVTEEVLGVDLVKAQLLTAGDDFVIWRQEELIPRGHSIECRIYAEDPYNMGMPSTGTLGSMIWPEGPGRRFEVGLEAGDEITSYYDPMVAKVIVWDESRPRAIRKMLRTLDECVVFGVKLNLPYLKAILNHPEFIDGTMNTQFISKYFADGLPARTLTAAEQEVAKQLLTEVRGLKSARSSTGQAATGTGSGLYAGDPLSGSSPWQSRWSTV